MSDQEIGESFACFGSSCSALVIGDGPEGSAQDAVALARRKLLDWHARFSRFLSESELSIVNGDPRGEVPVSGLMARFARVVAEAGSLTGGLVDATLLDPIERAGYGDDLRADPLPLATALQLAPARRPAGADPDAHWRLLRVDRAGSTLTRPPGVKLDSGGLAKGLFADVLGERLAGHAGYAINCAGDLSIGGSEGIARPIRVESPFDGSILHTFHLARTGVATSGIGRRSWIGRGGRPAHHLLDPATGEPAFTGIVQVTALAPSAVLAEIRAKAALLSGPRCAPSWLTDGGVIVFDDGSHRVLEPPVTVEIGELSSFIRPASAARSALRGRVSLESGHTSAESTI
jgi:thiamine biosynthesis lipoprotein